MPKIDRKKLSRGTKLSADVVFDPLLSAATKLSAAAIDKDSLKTPYGTFRLNLNIPRIPYKMWDKEITNPGSVHVCIPFMLPPLQDEITASGTLTETSTTYTLTEFGISFDQRGEPAAIEDGFFINYDKVKALDLIVSLVEKRPLSYEADAPIYPEREVASFRLEPVAFSGRTLRLNPFLLTGLAKDISPYKSYMVMIRSPIESEFQIDFASFNVTLKFKTPLTARDRNTGSVATPTVQNMPTVHDGAKTNDTVTVVKPAADSSILADGAGGMNTGLTALDAKLGERLEGGYLADGDVPVKEHLTKDSCYEIIAVPLWQAFSTEGILYATNAADAAWIDLSPGVGIKGGPIIDWRRIPIDYPFVLHHVIAMSNFAAPPTTTTAGGRHPTGNRYFRVGVLMGTGIRSDLYQYEQLAYRSWLPGAHAATITADRLTNKADGRLGKHSAGEEHDYELTVIPLVNSGAATPFGMRTMGDSDLSDQGRPIFIGRGNTKTSARTNVNARASTVLGNEQFIEVRWQIFGDNVNLDYHATGGDDLNIVYAGFGGNWVYLIGRKAIAADIAEIEPSAK